MVRLYIHYKPENMNIEYIQKYFIKSSNKIELDSLDFGRNIIELNNIYRIEPNFNMKYEIKEKYYKNYDLIIDYTIYNKIKVLSQLPSKYIYTKITTFEYKINDNSNLKLYIEFVKDIDSLNKDILNNNILKPIHFYFEYNENKLFNEDNINEEINEFLSLLI